MSPLLAASSGACRPQEEDTAGFSTVLLRCGIAGQKAQLRTADHDLVADQKGISQTDVATSVAVVVQMNRRGPGGAVSSNSTLSAVCRQQLEPIRLHIPTAPPPGGDHFHVLCSRLSSPTRTDMRRTS